MMKAISVHKSFSAQYLKINFPLKKIDNNSNIFDIKISLNPNSVLN